MCPVITPESEWLCEILTRNISNILTLCDDPPLSCNSTLGGAKITNMAQIWPAASQMSDPLLGAGAGAGVAAALLRRF